MSTFHEIKIVNTETIYSVDSRIAIYLDKLKKALGRDDIRLAYGEDRFNPNFSTIWIGDTGRSVASTDKAAMMFALEFLVMGLELRADIAEDEEMDEFDDDEDEEIKGE